MPKITLQNTRNGGFGLPGGPVIAGGASLEVERADWDEVKDHPVVKAWLDAGHLVAGKADPLDHDGDGKKGGSLPNRTAQEVLAMADDTNVPFMTFKAAAAKLLGDKTPAKKDEIVTALMELATNP